MRPADPAQQPRAIAIVARLDRIHRHGKYLLFSFDGETAHAMLHLRMTGQLLF
ncbi:DNA-formamidopyrimidine glycosylase family protein, partial [Sphingomonas sp.]|uniref:DNA-formamidopyrimidine glycosylase family protein n=1 Tax=Sphingomonas sp. TaxID=28214 RepID=UPI00338F61A3